MWFVFQLSNHARLPAVGVESVVKEIVDKRKKPVTVNYPYKQNNRGKKLIEKWKTKKNEQWVYVWPV